MGDVVLVAAFVVGLLLAGPVMALIAFTRVRQLERRLAELERRAEATGAPRLAGPAPRNASATYAAPAQGAAVEPSATTAPAAIPPLLKSTAEPPAEVPQFSPLPDPIAAFDWETIIAGRWLNRVGLLAVAIGVSYFLKYAIDNDWIGPHGQVAIGLLLGAGLVLWSERFTARGWHYFADGIAGLGAAVLYLSLWAGASYYRFVSTNVGFAAMIVVTAAMVLVALGRNRTPLAALALVGGFLTPWLVSTGQDAQVVLFSYLALHNAALLALARKRDWRFLEWPAFIFTQIYFWAWFGQFYSDDVLLRTALFGMLFFAQFSVLPFVRVRRAGEVRPEHGLLVAVNVAVFLLTLRVLLWPEHRWALTFAALGLSAFHLALAKAVSPSVPTESPARRLPAGLALTLATVAIAMRLDGHWVTLAWAVEAGLLAWTGFDAGLRLPRAAAYALFAAVAIRLFAGPLQATDFLFNARLATAVVVAASAAFAVRSAGRHKDDLFDQEAVLIAVLAVAANVLVLWALTLEIDLFFHIAPGGPDVSDDVLLARSLTISLLWTLYATGLVAAGVRFGTAALRWQGLALFGATTLKVFFSDLGYLSGFYRIVSSIALGVVLLIVSFLYQRSLAASRQPQENQP